MKTLVIHPVDSTTDFLSVIYKGKDWTTIRQDISKSRLRRLIKDHDRIIMLGHGTDLGLLGIIKSNLDGIPEYKYVIDSTFIQLLRTKSIVAIWCNADEFVKKYKLKGFFTGMIISDYTEANLYCIQDKGTDIDDSNTLFADSIAESIDHKDMLGTAKALYKKDSNNVVNFNKLNLYYV